MDLLDSYVDFIISNNSLTVESTDKLLELKKFTEKIFEDRQTYIHEIAELNSELDANMQLIADAQSKIQELNTRLAMETTCKSKSKPYMSEKKARALENELENLKSILTIYSSSDLEGKAEEVDDYLKRIIKLRTEIDKLKNSSRIKKHELDNVEESLIRLEAETSDRYIQLNASVLRLKAVKDEPVNAETLNELIENVVFIVTTCKFSVYKLLSTIHTHRSEIEALRNELKKEGESDLTREELFEQLKAKDELIKAYKDKIVGLEYELKKTGK